MTSPFDGLEVETQQRAATQDYAFDLAGALDAIVALEATVPDDAHTAESLGTLRLGNGVVIGPHGLVLTMGYLILEAENVVLTTNAGRRVLAHVLGADPVTGLGLVQAFEPLDLPVLRIGRTDELRADARVIIAGAGGPKHAAAGRVLTRMPFAGSWEYLLEDAIMTEPAHPHWSGAALIGDGGDLLGVGSLSLTRQTRAGPSGLNMFVPVDLLPPILDDLAQGLSSTSPRPWLGALTQEVGEALMVVGVSPGGPAARAELRPGDAILALEGAPFADQAAFYRRLWALGEPGVRAELAILREGDLFNVSVRTMDRTALFRKTRPN
ncbi:MAG: signal protein PDZ [Phenylobacterium zucineum]|nr:MAG: signal protein PDZ [Phenylobacterium zucineum]